MGLINKMSLVLQVMVTNVTSLLKTVKAVEDEHTRGTRALEATIEAIAQEIRVSLADAINAMGVAHSSHFTLFPFQLGFAVPGTIQVRCYSRRSSTVHKINHHGYGEGRGCRKQRETR